MEPTKTPKPNTFKAIVFIIILATAIWYFFGGGETKVVNNQLQQIENKVADDAVQQYEIAKRQGDKIQTYTQAGMVAAAYLKILVRKLLILSHNQSDQTYAYSLHTRPRAKAQKEANL
jgi:hypothetical protein